MSTRIAKPISRATQVDTVAGRVIHHQPAFSGVYVGSPSLAILPSGTYVASHDLFGSGGSEDTTLIHASSDKGVTWRQIATIKGQYWSGLFVHRGALFIMGTERLFGPVVIRRSIDGGVTWTHPTTANNGRLRDDSAYHTAPVPLVISNGKIWRAMEESGSSDQWPHRFRPILMSARVDRSLLRAKNWHSTVPLDRPASALEGQFIGWLEGNVVKDRTGKLINIVRVDSQLQGEQVAFLELGADGQTLVPSGFASFPGGSKKFSIRYDEVSDAYWTITNWVPERHYGRDPVRTRNTLALARSADLRKWEVTRVLVEHHDPATHGFQYADWLFEGDDIVSVIRTAATDEFGGAQNQHDANFLTFLRVPNFRIAGPV